jgi:hypothetical protein
VMRDYHDAALAYGADVPTVRARIEDLIEPGVVDHLDFESLYFDRDDAFYDGDHLNGVGRGHFTRVLAASLVELGIDVNAPRRR